MFEVSHPYSTVTAILPDLTADKVAHEVVAADGTSALLWQARGTLLRDNWWDRWVPPVSPGKTVMQMLVPAAEVRRVVGTISDAAKLHQQASGAVFSTPCDHVYLGAGYHAWPQPDSPPGAVANTAGLREKLSVIFCTVDHERSDRVARGAIDAGAHGPIVYYVEGRGLRDRLGWLRITKNAEKEVLMVIADEADVEEVFDAMAKAGALHLPGRGFMYRLSIDTGLFNLPSRLSHHHYAANMQQIITAIDHLAGHTHWRDQTVFSVGGNGKGIGLQAPVNPDAGTDHVCITATVRGDNMTAVLNLMLDAGAPGLSINMARFIAARASNCEIARARVNDEYAVLRCVTDAQSAATICAEVDNIEHAEGVDDLCVTTQRVPKMATYVPAARNLRWTDARADRTSATQGF